MKKEFESLKNIVIIHFGAIGFLNPSENEQILKDRDKVLDALDELKAIKEAKPSEALECLEKLPYTSQGYGNWKEYYNTIKQALLKTQEQEKKIEKLKEWFMELNKKLKNRYLTYPAQIELAKKVLEFLKEMV